MEELLNTISEFIALAIEVTAVVVVTAGSAYAFVAIVRVVVSRRSNDDKRLVWLEYARWLVAALTFQLAADIVRTTIAPTWNDVGKTGAIAVIRTFLTYFLDRDMDEARERGERKNA
jgi:uncharacterized membrane protein